MTVTSTPAGLVHDTHDSGDLVNQAVTFETALIDLAEATARRYLGRPDHAAVAVLAEQLDVIGCWRSNVTPAVMMAKAFREIAERYAATADRLDPPDDDDPIDRGDDDLPF